MIKNNLLDDLSIECEKAIQSMDLNKINIAITSTKEFGNKYLEDVNVQIYSKYFLGNLHSTKAKVLKENSFSWRNGIFPQNKVIALNYYRQSQNIIEGKELGFYSIQTNMANELNGFCRTIEAIELLNFNYENALH